MLYPFLHLPLLVFPGIRGVFRTKNSSCCMHLPTEFLHPCKNCYKTIIKKTRMQLFHRKGTHAAAALYHYFSSYYRIRFNHIHRIFPSAVFLSIHIIHIIFIWIIWYWYCILILFFCQSLFMSFSVHFFFRFLFFYYLNLTAFLLKRNSFKLNNIIIWFCHWFMQGNRL